ncbi:MAG: FtsQ-type POTRA domain-containing protein [Caldilineae bacterium]|nr:MAG: FtsQ-type POTRA domain-containing protein [Caldilineae bacterium]
MKILTPPQRTPRRRRRSARRLGASPQVMENRAAAPPLGLGPALAFWQVNRSRITGAMVLLLCLWILYLLFTSDAFYVYGAQIEGNHILSDGEIYAAAAIEGWSVFWVNPRQVRANLEALPNVKEARVRVALPARVTIEVAERQPEVVWQTGDTAWWIDNEGTFVPPRADGGANQNRLRIIDLDNRPVQANDRIDLTIVRGAQIVREHKPEVSELYYTQAIGLVYVTPEGWPIYLGDSGQMAAKIRVAEAVRTDLLARNVSPLFVDVRNPRRVVYQEQ